jgi:hypothetical protein
MAGGVACTQLNFFSSFFNVDQGLYNNASIQLQFPSGESDWISIDYTIPDGHYTTSAFNALLSKIAFESGFYTASGTITTRYVDLANSAYQYANVLQPCANRVVIPGKLHVANPDRDCSFAESVL